MEHPRDQPDTGVGGIPARVRFGDEPGLMSKADLRLLGRALRSRWKIPRNARDKLMERTIKTALESPDDVVSIAAVNTLLKADSINLKQEQGPAKAGDTNVQINLTGQSVQQALQDPQYLEYLRASRLEISSDPGDIRGDDQPGAVEAGPPPDAS